MGSQTLSSQLLVYLEQNVDLMQKEFSSKVCHTSDLYSIPYVTCTSYLSDKVLSIVMDKGFHDKTQQMICLGEIRAECKCNFN